MSKIFRCLLRIAEQRGIEVILDAPLPKLVSGLWWDDGNNEYIGLSSSLRQDPAKMNFVLAHELGHSILHKGRLDSARYQENCWNNDYRKTIEAEANSFAEKLIQAIFVSGQNREEG